MGGMQWCLSLGLIFTFSDSWMLATRILCLWTQEGISVSFFFFALWKVFSFFVSRMVILLPDFELMIFISVIGIFFVGC